VKQTIQTLADLVSGEVEGNPAIEIHGVGTLQNASPGQISFLANPIYRKQLAATRASAVILHRSNRDECKTTAIVVVDPHVAYAKIAAALFPQDSFEPGIAPSAVVSASATIAASASIQANSVIGNDVVIGDYVVVGPNCTIERAVKIGSHTRLVANVTICHGSELGSRVLVHPGAVIGSDGFGLANDRGVWIKVPQLGKVRIGDDVEIGANTSIDRGALEDTLIENGVKLDNQIQIAHNVQVGAHTAIAGCVGVSGSTKIGRHCAIGGGVGISGHLEIADKVTVTGMSLVSKSIPESGVYSGSVPAMQADQWRRNFARVRKLDEMFRKLATLEKQVRQLLERK